MNPMFVIVRIFDAFPVQNLLTMHIVASSFPKRKYYLLRMILHALPMIILYDMTKQAYPDNMIENLFLDQSLMMLPLLYTFLGMLFCYDCDFTGAVFCSSCAAVLTNLALNLYYIIKLQMKFEEGTIPSLACSLSLMLVFSITFWYFFARTVNSIKWPPIIRRQILMTAILFLILQTYFNIHVPGAKWEERVYFAYIITDIAMLIMQISISRESVLEQKYNVIEELLHSEQKKHQMTAENVELINRKCHDLKHQLAGIKRMQNEDERQKYIQGIESAVLFYESAIKTGNETLDLIMMEKLLYCQEHEIKLTCISDAEKLNSLETPDIYSLFGNAIDNAIESVSEEPDPSKRVISMRIGSWGGFLTIHVENYLGHEITISNGLPVTTKENKEYHGFGVLSIRHIVEKYHGEIRIRTDNNQFQLDILIPVE